MSEEERGASSETADMYSTYVERFTGVRSSFHDIK